MKVFAKARRIHKDSRAEDYAFILMVFENNVDGTIETNRLTPYKTRILNVVGTNSVSQLDYIEQKLVIHDGRYVREAIIKKEEPLKLELRHFIQCVLGLEKPLTSGVDGLNALKVAEAALKSSRSGEVVEIKW